MGHPKHDWTEERLRILWERFHDTCTAEIARMVGCCEKTVWSKARELGLTKDPLKGSERARRAQVKARAKHHVPRTAWKKGEHVSPETEFKPGDPRFEGENFREKWRKGVATRKRTIYHELLRIQNGLPQMTRMRLKRRWYIDPKKYLTDNNNTDKDKR